MGVQHSVIDLLMQCLQATGMIVECPQSVSLRKTTPREDRFNNPVCQTKLVCFIRSYPRWIEFWGHVSVRTANRRVNEQRMRKRRPIKRLQLSLRHRRARWNWSRYPLHLNIRN